MDLDDSMNQLTALLAEAREGFVSALPNLLAAIVVLLFFWGLASLLRSVVQRFFRRVALRIPGAGGAPTGADAVQGRETESVAANGVYWLVLGLGLVLAFDVLDLPVLRRWMGIVAGYLPRLALAVAVVLSGVVLGRVAQGAIVRTAFRMPPAQAMSLGRLTRLTILLAALLVAAGQLGLDVSFLSSALLIALAATLGAAALAFGLGARGLMGDILAMHYFNKTYRIGQLVRVGPDEGRIVRTSSTAVYLENAQGELAIPGRDFAESRCLILSKEDDREPRG